MASAAAKPCHRDSFEFYLIAGSINTDKRRTVVIPMVAAAGLRQVRFIATCSYSTDIYFFFNNDLEYLRGGSIDRKYTTSTTKTKAAKYEIEGIEDMVPKVSRHDVYSTMRILSVTSVTVNKWLNNLGGNVIFDLAVALLMYTRRIVLYKRVEDLQSAIYYSLGTSRSDLRRQTEEEETDAY
ncbi:hypothetical protein Tco_1247517 [Tanacetum coccineum]